MRDNSLKGSNHYRRNSKRWGGWSANQLYVTAGSLALKDRYRPTELPMLTKGQVIARGLVKVLSLWREGLQWLYNILFDGVVYIKRTFEEVVAIWATAYGMKGVGAVQTLASAPAPTLALPAPHVQLAGLLPAVCA